MVNRNLLRQFDLSEEELGVQLAEAMGKDTYDESEPFITFGPEEEFDVNKIVKGRVLNIVGDDVIVDGMARIFFPGAPVRLAQTEPAQPR